jgi:hypothetical protein
MVICMCGIDSLLFEYPHRRLPFSVKGGEEKSIWNALVPQPSHLRCHLERKGSPERGPLYELLEERSATVT